MMDNLVFEKKHDTNRAVIWLVENIVKAFKNKQLVLKVFLDLSEAFYTIDHAILPKNYIMDRGGHSGILRTPVSI